jgi:hypothetical protein
VAGRIHLKNERGHDGGARGDVWSLELVPRKHSRRALNLSHEIMNEDVGLRLGRVAEAETPLATWQGFRRCCWKWCGCLKGGHVLPGPVECRQQCQDDAVEVLYLLYLFHSSLSSGTSLQLAICYALLCPVCCALLFLAVKRHLSTICAPNFSVSWYNITIDYLLRSTLAVLDKKLLSAVLHSA